MALENKILTLSVRDLMALYRKKELSPVEVARACLERIARLNPKLNAFCLLDEKETLSQALESEKRWRMGQPQGELEGVPVSIKDWLMVQGWPTRYGSKISSADPALVNSPPVARLKEAGAVFIGKTTTPEYGHKGVTDSPLMGITRNPWDPAKTPGGSSGGAAVAAAIGAGFLHLGSDAGGSVRIPASFSGVFGFKPSPGIVPNWPPSLFSSLSSCGPLTRKVADAARMMNIIARPDVRDWHALPIEKPDYLAAVERSSGRRLKIAYARTVNETPVRKEVAELVDSAVKMLVAHHDVEEITLGIPNLISVFNRHWGATAAHMTAQFTPEQQALLDPRLQEWASRGARLPLLDYVSAERERMDIGLQLKQLLDNYDLLITPTTAMTAFETGRDMPLTEEGKRWEDWTPFTYIANLAKLPACSIPCGMTAQGLPVGLQMMSGFLKDALVLEAAAFFEELMPCQQWTELKRRV